MRKWEKELIRLEQELKTGAKISVTEVTIWSKISKAIGYTAGLLIFLAIIFGLTTFIVWATKYIFGG